MFFLAGCFLSCFMFSVLSGFVVWYSILIWVDSQSLWLQIFLLFLFLSSLLVPPKHVYYIFYIYPIWVLFLFSFSVYFSLFFHLEISTDTSLSSESLSSAISSLLISSSEALFIYVIVFLIYSIDSWNFHFSAYIIHLFLHVVYLFF